MVVSVLNMYRLFLSLFPKYSITVYILVFTLYEVLYSRNDLKSRCE